MRKKLLVSTFVVMAIMMAAFGTVASLQALPIGGIGFDDKYYSDSTFTVQVGEHYQGCASSGYWTGTRSEYLISETWDCNNPSEPNVCGYYHCPGYYWDRAECTYLGGC